MAEYTVCARCGQALRVDRRSDGREVVAEHECAPGRDARQDARTPGTSSGAKRYG